MEMIRSADTTGKTQRVLLFVVILALLVSFSTRAASLYTETFTGTNGGWREKVVGPSGMSFTNVLTGGNPGGALRGVFPPTSLPNPPLFPLDDSFVATGLTETASFVGDYTEVDAWMLGFDFMASNVVPAGFSVFIYSGTTNIISRSMTNALTQTNLWYSFRIPLLAAELGGWQGSVNAFSAILTNVTQVEFRITRRDNPSDTPIQYYFLDNVFLDRLPDAVDVSENDLVWLHMRNGSNYRLEATTNLNDGASWVTIDAFTATSSVYTVNISTTNEWRSYRMLMQ